LEKKNGCFSVKTEAIWCTFQGLIHPPLSRVWLCPDNNSYQTQRLVISSINVHR